MKVKILLFIVCLSFMGCSSSPNPTNILRVNFPEDPPALDPRKGGDPISTTVKFMLFEGLTRMTPKSTCEPALAQKITVSEDQTIYTFHLRESLWSDGKPLTAYDFEYTWKTLLEPSFPCPDAHLFYPIKNAKAAKTGKKPNEAIGVRAIDAQTLEVELEGPTPYFLDLVAFCIFDPVPRGQDFSEKVCNGPFKIERYRPSNQMALVKNPLYWDAKNVKLDGVEITFIEDETTALTLYQQKVLDFLGARFSPIPLDSLPTLLEQGALHTKPLGATTFCSFNTHEFPFSNPNIRKAFAYAMDRDEIVTYITQMHEEVALDPIPPILKENRVQSFFPKLEASEAQKFLEQGLKELGVTKDAIQDIPFLYLTGDKQAKIAQALQNQWFHKLGIRVRLEGYQCKTYLNELVHRNYQLACCIWIIQYPDLMNILERFKFKDNAKNFAGWENAEYIKILDTSMSLSSPSERTKHLEKAEKILMDEMPLAPIYHWKEVYLQQPYVKGVYISPIGSMHLGQAYINKEAMHED